MDEYVQPILVEPSDRQNPRATRSPRFRFVQKLEAQKSDRKDRSQIKDPKQSIGELFHPRKPKRN